jgi:hypothetical protein
MSKKHNNLVAHRTQDSKFSSVTATEYVPAPAAFSKTKDSTRKLTICEICNKPISFKHIIPEHPRCRECIEQANKVAIALSRAEKAAKEAEIASRIHKKCRTCSKEFYITAAKAEKMKDLGLELFSTCYACQQVKNASKEKNDGQTV